MRWSNDGRMMPTDIFDAATLHYSTQVSCGCGHTTRFESRCLFWHFTRRGWDHRFEPAKGRFWCRMCASRLRRKVRAAKIEPVLWAEGDFALPGPGSQEWKRLMARLR